MGIWFQPRGVTIFVFHSVENGRSPGVGSWVTSVQSFRNQLDFIQEEFEVEPVSDMLSSRKRDRTGKPRACITFDDGDPSWLGAVRRELLIRNLRATFYVATDQIKNRPIWHDRLSFCLNSVSDKKIDMPWLGIRNLSFATTIERSKVADALARLFKYQTPNVREQMLERLEIATGVKCNSTGLSAEDLCALANDGHEIGSHTKSHPILSHCDDGFAMDEIGGSKEILESILRLPIKSFSYPNGKPAIDYLGKHVEMVKKTGYKSAVSTSHGGFSDEAGMWEIPRFSPWGETRHRMRRQVFLNSWSKRMSVEGAGSLRPRVLIIENGPGFGGAVVALDTLLGFIPPNRAAIGVVSGASYKFEKIPCVEMVEIASTKPKARIGRVAKLLQKLRVESNSILGFFVGRIDDVVFRLPYLIRVLIVAYKFRPDVMHGNNELVSNREAMWVAKILRVPYIQHIRGPFPRNARLDYLLNGPSLYLAVSRWLYFESANAGVELGRLEQVYDGIAIENNAASDGNSVINGGFMGKWGEFEDQVPVVAMIGMLVPWKGQDLFIEAVAKIYRNYPSARFLIVGGVPSESLSDYREYLVKKVRDLGLSECVNFTGQIPCVADKMGRFDVVVSASIEPEPLGLIMVEALRKGCYFIGPDHGATAEFIKDESLGLLFNPGSPDSLAQAIETALDERIPLRGGTNSRGRSVPIEVSLPDHAHRMIGIYEGLASVGRR